LKDLAKRLLKSTRWIAEGGLKPVSEVMSGFRLANKLYPRWEKSHFEFGKYLHSVLEARISGIAQHEGLSAEDEAVREYALSADINCQNYLYMAMEQYLSALSVNSNHVYQALPRFLSLWFEYTAIEKMSKKYNRDNVGMDTPVKLSSDPSGFLRRKKEEANKLFSSFSSKIPSSAFYTALPQLIARLCHPNSDTRTSVKSLLVRVLARFPAQALWSLAWVRNSIDKTRSQIGREIFSSAQKRIGASDRKLDPFSRRSREKSHNLLAASQKLVLHLIDIAKHIPKDDKVRSFKLARWKGEALLSDFLPPIQSVLSTPVESTRGTDQFPRLRAFHAQVQIMSSKAKPKRVKFYVVPAAHGTLSSPGLDLAPAEEDIGELHFLVKNEAKGDLRKDARVQDLNNVINRLMATAGKKKRQRRLHLRTFAVTCLSEDCGIVEWVPNTESFRSLVSKTYNPQAAAFSQKRRGKRIAQFADPSLRRNYEAVQDHFFKNGDLTRAAHLFEVHFLNSYPPLFYWWFVQTFLDPHTWYEARTNFTTSAAVWSAVGHVIGLGDRHSENLLIDTATGGCVHVDFDW
jgi:serine/threonine-protein kinase ATR